MKKLNHKGILFLIILTEEYRTKPMAYFVEKMQKNNCNRLAVIDEFPPAAIMHRILDTDPDMKMDITVDNVQTINPSLN